MGTDGVFLRIGCQYLSMKASHERYMTRGLVVGGMIGAELVSKHLLSSKPVLVKSFHIHHWMVGAGMCAAGLLSKRYFAGATRMIGDIIAGAGVGVFLHDAKDFLESVR